MITWQMVAPVAGLPALSLDVVVEVVFVVCPQVPHSDQDDDHNQGNDSYQNDQHRLVHRTIHRGVGLNLALAAPVSAIDTSTPVTSSALDSIRINR
jgi:hypothetical protein